MTVKEHCPDRNDLQVCVLPLKKKLHRMNIQYAIKQLRIKIIGYKYIIPSAITSTTLPYKQNESRASDKEIGNKWFTFPNPYAKILSLT